MKKTLSIWLFVGLSVVSYTQLRAQNVIGGSAADPTAILDLQSSTKGLLMPRMTTAQRAGITNPAAGLMVYNTSLGCVEVNAGTAGSPAWTCLFSLAGEVETLGCGAAAEGYTVPVGLAVSGLRLPIAYTGGRGGFYSSQVVTSTGVSGLTASIAAGAFGYGAGSIYCTITGTPAEAGTATFALSIGGLDCSLNLNVLPLGNVGSIDCAGVVSTGTPGAGVAVSGVSASVPYTAGNGGAYTGQTVNSAGVTGLTATLSAGVFASGNGSVTYTITGTPSGAGTASFALTIGGQTCTLQLSVGELSCGAYIASGVWKEFMCYNLGVTTDADPFTPNWELNGNYYQWGRNPTCFGRDGVDGTNPCSSPVYGAAAPWGNTTANDNAGSITGWNTTPAANGAWADGSKTVNDPCPTGWRVPTADQWSGVRDVNINARVFVGTWMSSSTNFGSGIRFGRSLFLPMAGDRGNSNGALYSRGVGGNYWSSTIGPFDGSTANFLEIIGVYARINSFNRTHGYSLRCIEDTGSVSALHCADASHTGTLTAGVAANGQSSSVPYSGGNGRAHNGQTVASTGVTGLTATLAPGTFAIGSGSLTYTITGTPSGGGTASFALNIGGQTCTLQLTVPFTCGAFVAAGVWKQFMCHNLGANTSADPFTPSWELNGNYYQWGRNPTCFGLDGVDGANPCSSPVYGAAGPWGNTTANDNAGAITGWSTTSAASGAWLDDSKTANDPCPTGWRVPTAAQLGTSGLLNTTLNPRTSVGTWTSSSTNYSAGYMFGQSLFLPAAGYRSSSNGSLYDRGSLGFYWSSTESGSNAQSLYFFSGGASMGSFNRSNGFSLRCVAE